MLPFAQEPFPDPAIVQEVALNNTALGAPQSPVLMESIPHQILELIPCLMTLWNCMS